MSAGLDGWKVLDLASGLLWVGTYALVVRRAFLDRASGVPLLALAATFTWELVYTVVHPTPTLPRWMVPAWLSVDAAILYQYLRYGLAERWGHERAWFLARTAAALVAAFALVHTATRDLRDRDGIWSAFGVNAVLSLAFVSMAERRTDVRGQSMYIATGKLAGSALAIPHAHALHPSLASLHACMAVMLSADVVYVGLLHRRCRALGIAPWRRV